jgi:hypothetical protein
MLSKSLLGCAMALFLVDAVEAQDAQTVIAKVTRAIGAKRRGS